MGYKRMRDVKSRRGASVIYTTHNNKLDDILSMKTQIIHTQSSGNVIYSIETETEQSLQFCTCIEVGTYCT